MRAPPIKEWREWSVRMRGIVKEKKNREKKADG